MYWNLLLAICFIIVFNVNGFVFHRSFGLNKRLNKLHSSVEPAECDLMARIRSEKMKAMIARQRIEVDAMASIQAAVQTKEKDEKIVATDTIVMQVIGKLSGMVKESIEVFTAGNRTESVIRLQAELGVLQSFLPQQMTPEEVQDIITESINRLNAVSIKDMGKVMADIKPKLIGKTDVSLLGEILKKKLTTPK